MYFVVKALGLSQNYLGISLAYAAINFPFGVFIYTGYFKTVPVEIDESVIMDGASPLTLFFKIIFPLVKPATATLLILMAMTVWNDFGVSLFLLHSPKRFTVVLTTFAFMGQNVSLSADPGK
jgi:raffinose/stachyose/melibiose transport system permease protein